MREAAVLKEMVEKKKLIDEYRSPGSESRRLSFCFRDRVLERSDFPRALLRCFDWVSAGRKIRECHIAHSHTRW